MSKFVTMVQTVLAVPSDPISSVGQTQVELGRELGCHYIDARRNTGLKSEDALMVAVALAGKAGGEVLRGFLREINDLVKESGQ